MSYFRSSLKFDQYLTYRTAVKARPKRGVFLFATIRGSLGRNLNEGHFVKMPFLHFIQGSTNDINELIVIIVENDR